MDTADVAHAHWALFRRTFGPAMPAFMLVLACALVPSGAASADCKLPADQKLIVRVVSYPTGQDRSISIAKLSKQPNDSRRKGLERYDYALGLTEATLQAGAQAEISMTTNPQGGFCSAIAEATITIEWRTLVHIASEIKPGTCVFDVVSKHEQKHVDLDRKLIPAARAEMETALRAVARRPVSAPTAKESQRVLQERISRAINTTIDAFSARRSRRQLAIDTPQEYDRVPQTCGRDALNRLLGS